MNRSKVLSRWNWGKQNRNRRTRMLPITLWYETFSQQLARLDRLSSKHVYAVVEMCCQVLGIFVYCSLSDEGTDKSTCEDLGRCFNWKWKYLWEFRVPCLDSLMTLPKALMAGLLEVNQSKNMPWLMLLPFIHVHILTGVQNTSSWKGALQKWWKWPECVWTPLKWKVSFQVSKAP